MLKTCSRCGKEQPIGNFRTYYGNRTGTYKYCKACEKLESRRKYLSKKVDLTDTDIEELNKINRLYDYRRAEGLDIPGEHVRESIVDSLLAEYE